MTSIKKVLWFLFWVFLLANSPTVLFAQNSSNLRYIITADSLLTDSLTILPNTVTVQYKKNGLPIDSFVVTNNQIFFPNNILPKEKKDTLIVIYRVLPVDLMKNRQHLDSSDIQETVVGGEVPIELDYNPYATPQTATNDLFGTEGLQYNGAFGRGLSVGNAQNLVLNSNFNLQLGGKLGDDLEIEAAISDNNIPLQAEGNTRQLREFDRIYIQIRKAQNTLLAGDYELRKPDGTYFMNYNKKLQGATFTNISDIFKDSLRQKKLGILTSKASLAIAKGKFNRQTITQIEGNQGPYRLQGAEGESFIIVLSGTEKVYIDGLLMQRGDDGDYTIDYNRGDITFTPRRLITKDRRIIIEFEYTDQSYLRTLYAVGSSFQSEKLQLNFQLYNESDSKNSSGTQALDSLDRLILARAGNNILGSAAPSFRPDAFGSDKVMYKLVDTLQQDGSRDSVLVYTASPDSARFIATFTPVGEGQGDYVQVSTSVNGRVYRWVGKGQGNFLPIKRLIAPIQKRLMTLGINYQLLKTTQISTELALSDNDLNTFSALGDTINRGIAAYTTLKDERILGKKKTLNLKTTLQNELTRKNFRPLNPYRAAEFSRDWNVTNTQNNNAQQISENLLFANTTLSRKDVFSLGYDFGGYFQAQLYEGLRHGGAFSFQKKTFQLQTNATYLTSESPTEKTNFFRPNFNVFKVFVLDKKLKDKRQETTDSIKQKQPTAIKIGVMGEREQNKRFSMNTDTLNRASFYYDQIRYYAEIPRVGEKGLALNTSFLQRLDYVPQGNDFQKVSRADEFSLQGGTSRLNFNLTYRNLFINQPTLTTLKPQTTYLGRTEYNLSAYKGAIYSNTLYEIGSGQEQRLEYQYVKVRAGEGQYIWRNRNEDTIPQLNEFEIAQFQDQADYVRVTLLTNQFIRTNNVQLNQSLRLDPRSLWFNQKGLKQFLSRFSAQSLLQINRRVKADDKTVQQWNPLQTAIADTSLIALTSAVRNSLWFNRTSAVYDLELGQLQNRTRLVLTTGFEERSKAEIYLRSRINFGKAATLQNTFTQGTQANRSEAFRDRTYTIQNWKIEPLLTLFFNSNFRTILGFKYRKSENTVKDDGEISESNDFSAEITYNKTGKTQIRSKVNIVDVRYTGERNTPTEYAMLEGLQRGKNYLWNVNLERALTKSLQLSLNYEGRKTGETRIVHVGRASIRATF